MGFFDFLKPKPKKTASTVSKSPHSQSLWQRLKRIFSKQVTLEGPLLEEIESILLTADIGLETTDKLISALQKHAGSTLDLAKARKILKKEILACLPCKEKPSKEETIAPPTHPHVTLIVGVNGVGKTTTIGKLAYLLSKEGKKVMLAAGDTFRAAAIEQLQRWGEKLQLPVVSHGMHKDPGAVAYDAVQQAIEQGIDTLIIDTAGRLHNKVNLMQELAKIKRVIQKKHAPAPQEILLVLDGSTGQNASQQAALFNEALNITGLVVTKLDGVAKGGSIVRIANTLGLPITYIGVGEKAEDLQKFDAEVFVEQLLESSAQA